LSGWANGQSGEDNDRRHRLRHAQDRDNVVTLYDVARLAGVSIATVSRVVHGQDKVRDATRARVQQAIKELGYVPDGAAQSLSRRRKDVIGLACKERDTVYDALEEVGLVYWDQVLRGVEERIRNTGWSLLISFLHACDPAPPQLAELDVISGKVDGILVGEGFGSAEHIERLAARVPVVVIAGAVRDHGSRAGRGECAQPGGADVVAADNFSGSAAITTHLISEHRKRRLFHLDGPSDAPDTVERRLALHHVLRGNPQCRLIGSAQGTFTVRSGEQAGQELLVRYSENLPDAVVCANDQMAIGMLKALAAARVHAPAEIAVVGFDDIYPASVFDPPLTTVQQPVRMLGRQACSRLLDRIANPQRPATVDLLPTQLVLRASCGCPPRAGITQAVAAPPGAK
jgi:LacI family transcriptional regulator